MSVFEYSSVFIAILAGQIANEVLQRMGFIMQQDRWVTRYYAEWVFMASYLVATVSLFFQYFVFMSAAERITLLQFLTWVLLWVLVYFMAYFAPSPHPRENVSEIEPYFSKRLPHIFKVAGFGIIISQTISLLVYNPSLLLNPFSPLLWLGLSYILISFILGIVIDRYGIRKVKATFVFLIFTSLIGTFAFDLFPEMQVLE